MDFYRYFFFTYLFIRSLPSFLYLFQVGKYVEEVLIRCVYIFHEFYLHKYFSTRTMYVCAYVYAFIIIIIIIALHMCMYVSRSVRMLGEIWWLWGEKKVVEEGTKEINILACCWISYARGEEEEDIMRGEKCGTFSLLLVPNLLTRIQSVPYLGEMLVHKIFFG